MITKKMKSIIPHCEVSINCLTIIFIRVLVMSAYQKVDYSYFSTETFVVGTQKNRLNETVLLSTQNIC